MKHILASLVFPYAIEDEEVLATMCARYRSDPTGFDTEWKVLFDEKFPIDDPADQQ